jgi:phosphoglucomutase
MATKNKQQPVRSRPDTDVPGTSGTRKNKNTMNTRNNGAVNSANTIQSVRSRETGELHTKKTITGSDSDGQAE